MRTCGSRGCRAAAAQPCVEGRIAWCARPARRQEIARGGGYLWCALPRHSSGDGRATRAREAHQPWQGRNETLKLLPDFKFAAGTLISVCNAIGTACRRAGEQMPRRKLQNDTGQSKQPTLLMHLGGDPLHA